MLYPFLVVLSRALVLDSFPGEDVADGVVAEFLEAGEVDVCVFDGKRTLMEVYVVAVEEVVGDVGGHIGSRRIFGVAGDVDAAESYLAAVGVFEVAVFDGEAEGGHCVDVMGCRSKYLVGVYGREFWAKPGTGVVGLAVNMMVLLSSASLLVVLSWSLRGW